MMILLCSAYPDRSVLEVDRADRRKESVKADIVGRGAHRRAER
jgi:hypothetical protein